MCYDLFGERILGVKMQYRLTGAESKLIDSLRAIRANHCRVPCVIYIQDGKLARIEIEKVIESIKLI